MACKVTLVPWDVEWSLGTAIVAAGFIYCSQV